MSLLAYSVRRAVGALFVLLIVIWLIQFGVYHALSPPVNRSFPVPDYFLQFQDLVHQWNVAVLEVGVAAIVLLALAAAWRWAPNGGSRAFWTLVAAASVLLAFGLASFGVALANQDYRRLKTECPPQAHSCIPPVIARSMARQFDRGINPTPWWVAGSISTGVGLLLIGSSVTVRRRTPAAY
jgi:hypothetical protein